MDIPREPPKKRKRYILIGVALVAVVVITMALGRLEAAPPTVERGTLWIDTVRKGEMVRQVRGPGTLVPEQIRWVSAVTAGRVEQVHIRPGATVAANSLLLELSNPDVQLEALGAEQQLSAAEATLVTLKTTLETQRLNQEGVVATTEQQYLEANRNAAVAESLDKKRLLSPNEVASARDKAKELNDRIGIEKKRLAVMTESLDKQLALQQAQVEKLRDIAHFQEARVQSMKVLAGADGVLQEENLEPGQWVQAGTILAKVAQPGRLKAVLRIPETQAKDVQIGQPTSIDTRNGLISGHVMRIEPNAQNGTVGVDVSLEGELPKGARPDLSVDGTIEIERLKDVLYVGRPAYGQAESTVGIFRLTNDGKEASRVNVKLGRSSVNTIEVVQGLSPGDKVIVSDMSAWDSHDKVRIR
ncbi:MAG TPA: HlyD family efflux transporter periplasmic adaptor subunit [Gemmatimonadaceae bacterium]|nr:HlyD family efflux transporter periplasmic adaptor subunit [Gemmatimonadaceae bacterium]